MAQTPFADLPILARGFVVVCGVVVAGAQTPPHGLGIRCVLVGYGSLRFAAEYFREPDAHLGLLSLGLSMGQWLCVPMVLIGIGLMVWSQRRLVPVDHT